MAARPLSSTRVGSSIPRRSVLWRWMCPPGRRHESRSRISTTTSSAPRASMRRSRCPWERAFAISWTTMASPSPARPARRSSAKFITSLRRASPWEFGAESTRGRSTRRSPTRSTSGSRKTVASAPSGSPRCGCRSPTPKLFGSTAFVRGDGCGHPVAPCFGGASVAVLFQEPVLVVAIEVRPDGGADRLDVLEDTSENDLLLQRADEALGDAVGFRLTDESEAGRHAEEPQLVLEVLGHEPWS